jgi:hypothetical protein
MKKKLMKNRMIENKLIYVIENSIKILLEMINGFE